MMLTPEQKEAAKILLYRQRVQNIFLDFVTACGFKPAAHQVLIGEHLQQMAEGKLDRLLVNAPPGSAKSTLISHLFPAWCMAYHKGCSFLGVSHTYDLSERNGRRVRNLIKDKARMLDNDLQDDTAAAFRFATTNGSEFYAAGVLQAIQGFRATYCCIDDPLRSHDDAYSKQIRDSQIEWLHADLLTRLRPDGRVCICMTRFHEDDLCGHLISQMEKGGQKWKVLIIPAIAEENDALGRKAGEYLWDEPEYGYARFLRQQKAEKPPVMWNSMFQQRPAPETGIVFEDHWFKACDKLPPRDELRFYGATDFALSAGRGDFTVHLIAALDGDNHLYIVDMWRAQATPDKSVEAMLDLAERWKILEWAQESGQIRTAIGPHLETRMRTRGVYISFRSFPTKHDKTTRASSIRARAALSGIFINPKAHYWAAMRQEVLTFPASRNDDIVDALALVGQLLDSMVPVQRTPPPPERSNLDDYKEISADLAQRRDETWEEYRWRELETELFPSDDLLAIM
jgi:predicted phage terminase large subunit-like protein